MTTVKTTVNVPAPVVVPPTTVSIELTESDAKVLRLMLGGLKLKTRGGAVRKNGGSIEQRDRSKILTKEIIDSLEEAGVTLSAAQSNEPVTESYDADYEDSYEG